jgi:tetratricopeptide (TPR) repeat protein
MADGTAKPVIFISYSHKDRAWLDYVRSFFEPLAAHWSLQIWDDEQLRIGDDWRGDIYSAVDACRVFVLLVSRYALASTFIANEEVGRVLKRPRGEVQFCPIVVTPYYTRPLPWLDQPNRRPPDNKALSELTDPARDREMAAIAKQIDEIIAAIPAKTIAPVVTSVNRIAFPSIVDYGRLPETPYKKLVGRDDELRRLDDAWADDKTKVISLVAWGGAGKTSLVIEWLTRVRNDGYRNADAVLCWSFYSQGTQERAAAGEGFLDWALGKLKIKLDTTSASAKGERLAEELSRRRVLLVLDGLEPLQYGPDGQEGTLKDQGLRAFLRGLAVRQPKAGHSLVVLTSRLTVRDLTKWEESTTPLINLWRLSDPAGAALLAEAGVKGTPEELRAAAHDFAGHALALSLLGGFLKLLHGGYVSGRNNIRPAINDQSDSGHDQARRVIEAFAKEWLAGEPALLAIMQMVGLFDRPASVDLINALRAKPVIDGLTSAIAGLDEDAWRTSVARLRDVRLLDPEDSLSPDALDAHPLVREWFGERLKATNETAWKKAHGRLFEHLRDTTKEGKTPTLEDLAPLYQAIAHGCRAGRHSEARAEIYRDRICRWGPEGRLEYYSIHTLGVIGSDLAAISWFFDKPYETPVATLSPADQGWVLNLAAFCLRAQGRFAESLPAMRAALRIAEEATLWHNAGIASSNLSEAELVVGEVDVAVATAEQSIAYADHSGDESQIVISRTTRAEALHAAGRREEAERLFVDAEKRQKKMQPNFPVLFSVRGYQYCDLLLAKGDHATVHERSTDIIAIAQKRNTLLDIALGSIALGRADFGRALSKIGQLQSVAEHNNASAACARLDEAIDGLRAAGLNDDLPRGLLSRATLHRSVGDWDGTVRNLDEVEEVAEPGPMRLFLCDMALERARLAFARVEAFAPLNGMLEKDNPPKPTVPSAEQVADLKTEAEEQLKIAADYIEKCGYHRRDEELAELQAVLHGEKKFADLPPRL